MALGHHSLVAWQRADDLFLKLHQLSLKAFPAIERFELGAQLRRAAFSVPVNMVEGCARPKGRSRLNFFNIAKSSLAEVGYCIHVAQRLGYITDAVASELEIEIKRVGAPLDCVNPTRNRNQRRRRDSGAGLPGGTVGLTTDCPPSKPTGPSALHSGAAAGHSVHTSTCEPRRSAWSRIRPGPRRSRSSIVR